MFYFVACEIVGVSDPSLAMPSLFSQRELTITFSAEPDPQLFQFSDSCRTILNNCSHHTFVTQPIASS